MSSAGLPGNDTPDAGTEPPPSVGKLIRMRALKPTELPAHPDLASQQSSSSPPDLTQFVSSALAEGSSFIHAYLPKKFKVKHKDKGSHPSSAPVEVFAHDIHASEISEATGTANGCSSETWFARKSVHQNAAREGTASWEEFDLGLREDHSKHEMDYTPDVQDAHQVLDWEAQLGEVKHTVGEWHQVHMCIMEMVHHIPSPLNNRVFPVLVITAKAHNQFIVVQIPVDTTHIPGVKYSAGKKEKITTAMYCSIEHGELIDHAHKVCWQMATASDAKGSLPMWAQKMGVPGAVVKDVGLFVEWATKRRHGSA